MTNKDSNPNQGKDTPTRKPKGFSGAFLLLMLLSIFVMFWIMNMGTHESHSHYLFYKHLLAGNLTSLRIDGRLVTAKVRKGAPGIGNNLDEEKTAANKLTNFKIFFANLTPHEETFLRNISAWSQNLNEQWSKGATGTEQFIEEVKSKNLHISHAWILHEERKGGLPSRDKVFFVGNGGAGQIYGKLIPEGSNLKGSLLALRETLEKTNAKVTDIPILEDSTIFEVVQPNQLLPILLTMGPWLILAALIWFFFFRQMKAGPGGGVLSFGKSRAMLYNKENRTNVTFANVAGIKEAKEEVSELVKFLKDPQKFQRLGGRIPKGVLLVGSPGTGKTLLAKAIAGEAEVPFFSISGSDFVEMFVGVGASRVRDLFKQARDNSPCLIFLDEVDAVGRKRGSGLGGGHDEREQTLNAILVEMDGFGTDEGIILIAATNRPDVLDPALLRPGRFDRQITIDLPDLEGRKEILEVHAKNIELSDEVDLGVIAKASPSFSGADLAALINEAAILASVREKDAVEMEDLEEARDRIRWGREKKSRAIEEEDRHTTAFHEAGHALAAILMPETDPLHKVTIIPRGMALGSTMFLPEKDDYHLRKNKLKSMLIRLLSGRASEMVCCDDISAGAEHDIRQASRIARLMVAEWGMSEEIGTVSYTRTPEHNFLGRDFSFGKEHSEKIAFSIDQEVKKFLVEAYDKSIQICRDHQEALHRIADALLEHETITGTEVKALVEGRPLESVPREERWHTDKTTDETKAKEPADPATEEATTDTADTNNTDPDTKGPEETGESED